MISNARQLDGVLQIVVSEHITRANVEAGVIDFGDLLACSGCRQLHGAQPLLGLVAQQLQLRGTQVPEGGKLKLVTSSK